MNAGDFFAKADRLPIASLEELTGGGGLIVVAPHPDDESLGCGGLIAEACARRIAVALVVVSDGAGSHPHSRAFPAAALRSLRERETIAAAEELGLGSEAITFLRLPDRFVPTGGAEADRARGAIVEAARRVSAGAVLATWRHDPHCDHAATARLVDDCASELPGVTLLYYPIWGRTLAADIEVGQPPSGYRLDVSRHRAAKAAAIAAHRSQTTDLIDDDPDGFRLTAEMIARFLGDHEVFLADPRTTSRFETTIPRGYFDALYATDADPWGFAESAYEREKYAATLAALPDGRYAHALEVGCSIGVLTRDLAERCDRLVAIDISDAALARAKARCADLVHVRFERATAPAQWPDGRFDLLVLSEVVYYLDRAAVGRLVERIDRSRMPSAVIVLVHWLGATHYPLSGDEAAETFMAASRRFAAPVHRSRTREYRLDVLACDDRGSATAP